MQVGSPRNEGTAKKETEDGMTVLIAALTSQQLPIDSLSLAVWDTDRTDRLGDTYLQSQPQKSLTDCVLPPQHQFSSLKIHYTIFLAD
ncbi:hypothetical protein HI914_01915 [Erysiphe necator]|nr:hypothetical protein HI914_01915 [Erysiphe necator]